MTKQQVINKVEGLEEDNKALWHITSCLEEHRHKQDDEINKLKQEISKLNEEMRLLQKRSSGNTRQ